MTSDSTETMKFELLKARAGAGARLGRLTFSGSRTVDTPNFFAITSRGAVPHVTPDNLLHNVPVQGIYVALEDCKYPSSILYIYATLLTRSIVVERSQRNPTGTPAIYKTPVSPSRPRPLHTFTATPPSTLTLLAARRLPAVPSPQGNSKSSISIFTSTGFQNLPTADYQTTVATLRPDMAIPPADLTNTSTTPNSKRAERMAERTEDWLAQWFSSPSATTSSTDPSTAIFAPTLPIPYAMQWEYLTRMNDDFASAISGLAVYSADVIPDLTNHPALAPKPRLSLDTPATPHHILRQLSLGADIFLLPFLNSASDAGVALTFSFPAPAPSPDSVGSNGTSLQPLGKDISHDHFAFQVAAPLREGCTCYTCTHHHAAYVHHLLGAREMLGWTLLQIHNHAAAADFFAGVRDALRTGTFAAESARFQLCYEAEVPAGTGERPRARGYHFKSEGGDGKRNKKAWGRLGEEGDGLEVAEVEKERLERDLTETPVGADGDGKELDRRGFAEIDDN
jgi:queuine tRNA-ribosyltransferase